MAGSPNSEVRGEAGAAEAASSPTLAAFVLKKLPFCLGYIVISGGLIRFNKMLMREDRFPHSLALSAIHMAVSSTFCSLGYLLFPSFFPGMKESKGQRLSLMKWFVPIGCCFAVMLFGSNEAYKYCSVTFLQFMKEANVMIVFVFSCLVGLQSFTRLRCVVIVWVIAGASISVSGEVHFMMTGFLLQAMSQFAEVSRMIMGEIVLGSKKLDPLTYNMFLSPICLVVLLIANACSWSNGTLHDFQRWWPMIIANACLAFCLNVMVAAVIKECSAVGFVLTGLTKDIAIVVFSAFAFHEHVTRQQGFAFVVTIAGVFFWSYMKIYPAARPVQFLERLLGSAPVFEGEAKALLRQESSDNKDRAGEKNV